VQGAIKEVAKGLNLANPLKLVKERERESQREREREGAEDDSL
ncbi:hypothetical protein KIPB_012926, partial [Kipferlia bialata]